MPEKSAALDIELLPGEVWWGGAVADGQAMPFGALPHHRNLADNAGLAGDPSAGANQSAPLLLSSAGRIVWSGRPFSFTFGDGRLGVVPSDEDVQLLEAPLGTLREAFLLASQRFFPASGRIPARELFEGPQYNTWIEMPYAPTQDGVITYADSLLEAGFPPGVLMIDDRWSRDYGDWRFNASHFPDPTSMVEELRARGFRVMLWLVPFISPDSDQFRELRALGLLLKGPDGEVIVREWWNGFSAMLDVTNPEATAWLKARLDALRDEHGIDGFKFDAGDLRDYRADDQAADGTGPVDLCEAYARLGLEYSFNEYRACWKMGGQPLAQRLHDKPPTWGSDGLLSLVPEGLAQGLIGHAFTCADMVGGGDLAAFAPGASVDQEQFVRYAQCAALFPMMQFSINPSRVLDAEHLAAVHGAVALRQELLPEILALVEHAARTAEPVIRPLAYHHAGFEGVTDQFLLGEDILVAPVLQAGATRRTVVLPAGTWTGPDGVERGEGTVEIAVDLGTLPAFRRTGA
ncbi:glycoside hydrolase family 31 protein [Arthrobacter cavernae]|uniref:Alpha-galactosidase n=1 Tax=Arthrobacter cavernae TaxID=2817681 RepID=A0A939HLY1_9MICC|nr:glycoside hydrolase family 31 protein [Arthrobacter cavernae]MBO1269765.1 alpha-galactosidase [Arthrobacter cavernae]